MKIDNFNKFNIFVEIESPTLIEDDIGGQIVKWNLFCKVWTYCKKINNLAPQIRSNLFKHNFYKFVIRAQYNIKKGMRIILNDKIFYIQSINDSESKYYKELIAYERIINEFTTKNIESYLPDIE